jgi:AcrR family transcriptional regulator
MSDQATSDDREDERIELPPSIQLAWGLRDRPTRGPKRGLTLEQIVSAAIKVALTEGLGGLSMARVANELGVATMSLYRYVSAKDELLTLMVDAALGPPPPLGDPQEGWRSGLTRWTEAVRAAYNRHPWSLRVPISGPPLGPNNVAYLDAALRCLSETPLSEQDKLSIVLLLSGFVRNEATLTADFAAGGAGNPTMPGYGTMLAQLIDSRRFPALHRAIASGSLDDEDDADIEFYFGLQRILDGIEALM